jgi:hypothetical protein
VGKCAPSSSDSLFSTVYFDQFHRFMRIAANYNTMTDLLSKMPVDTAAGILKRFISGIEKNSYAALEKAMDISDAFNNLDAVPVIKDQFRYELRSNLERCRSERSFLGLRLYTILLQVFDLVNARDTVNQLWASLGDPEILGRKALQNKNGDINEVVLFYGDEDGNASYNNFMALFRDTRLWETEQNAYWITIRSVFKRPITIYANLPLDNDMELDLVAQDSLFAFLGREQIAPSIIFHRGHSYHLSNTMKRIQPSVKLAILGSCGGYNNILSIADLSPDAQVIVSKKMGSKFINDPLFDLINKTLQANKDLVWSDIWKKLTSRFKADEFLFNMFSEYIPPSRNLSLFVLKLFNYGR